MSFFLPKDFNYDQPLALIAGQGNYPILFAERAKKAGVKIRLIELSGETSPSLINAFTANKKTVVKVGQVGKLLKSLKSMEASYAVMAGQVTPGRLFRGLHPDFKAIRLLAGLDRKNAESIFGAIGEEIENIGVNLLDARIFMDEDLAAQGIMVKGKEKVESNYLKHGIEIAKENARLDIGQGVVVSQGTVLAVEAFEGTNEMLSRAGKFKAKSCIFVKISKKNQDTRFDVPVFGMQTLEAMKKAGIGNAALQTGSVLLLDKSSTLEKAKKLGIGITGF